MACSAPRTSSGCEHGRLDASRRAIFASATRQDRTIFPTRGSALACTAGVAVPVPAAAADRRQRRWSRPTGSRSSSRSPIYGIAALGLNILVGFTGQISLGHSAFFGFGAFMSAYLSGKHGVPVALSIPLAGIATGLLGVIVGLPAARLKGLYLAIATLASQFVLQDFFSRAEWFTGGASGANAAPFSLFGLTLSGDRKYYYVVLFYLVIMYVFAANLDAHARRPRHGGGAGSLSLRRDHGHQPHLLPHPGLRHLVVLRRHRRSADGALHRASCRPRPSICCCRSISSP